MALRRGRLSWAARQGTWLGTRLGGWGRYWQGTGVDRPARPACGECRNGTVMATPRRGVARRRPAQGLFRLPRRYRPGGVGMVVGRRRHESAGSAGRSGAETPGLGQPELLMRPSSSVQALTPGRNEVAPTAVSTAARRPPRPGPRRGTPASRYHAQGPAELVPETSVVLPRPISPVVTSVTTTAKLRVRCPVRPWRRRSRNPRPGPPTRRRRSQGPVASSGR